MNRVARRPVAERLRRWLIARCAPISIDGQTVEAITIDGQDVTEVTMDGDTVFEDAAIPDSAVFRQLWDEGSGTTTEDEIGSNDGTVTSSGQWVSNGDYKNGYGLSFGSNERVSLGSRPMAHSGQTMFAITIDDFSINGFAGIYHENDGNNYAIGFSDTDELAVTNLPVDRAWSNPTTGLQRIAVYSDWEANEVRIYSNATRVDDVDNSGAPTEGSDGVSIGNSLGGSYPLGGNADYPIAYEDVSDPSTLAQDDYDLQPWS